MVGPGSWEGSFDAHAPFYDANVFTASTVKEVDFLIEELGLAPGAEGGRFDPLTLTRESEVPPAEGHPPVRVRERGFVPTELALPFRLAGMEALHIWSGTAGAWNRQPVGLAEIGLMVVAQRPG